MKQHQQVKVVDQSNHAALADQAFQDYEFGDGFEVTDTSGWEYSTPGFERIRKVYVEAYGRDGAPDRKYHLTFTVRFDANGAIKEAYAIDSKGQIVGSMPDQQSKVLDSFSYQLLGRLQQDCDYYLGAGNRCKKHLWAQDEAAQVEKMRELYNQLPEKPQWLSLEQIEQYATRMLRDPEAESGNRSSVESAAVGNKLVFDVQIGDVVETQATPIQMAKKPKSSSKDLGM